jgi:hypothetical protein
VDEVLGARGVGGQKWKVYFCLGRLRQLDFCFFSGLSQSLDGGSVLGDIDSELFFGFVKEEFLNNPINILK